MNNTYWRLAQSVTELGQRVALFTQQLEAAESDDQMRWQGQAKLDEVQSQLKALAESFRSAAGTTAARQVPAAWDMVSIVPADEAEPGQAERLKGLPSLEQLNQPYQRAVNLLDELLSQLRRQSGQERTRRQAMAEELEQMKERLEHAYEVARGAHNAHYYKTYL